jgi:hypothetical protein
MFKLPMPEILYDRNKRKPKITYSANVFGKFGDDIRITKLAQVKDKIAGELLTQIIKGSILNYGVVLS